MIPRVVETNRELQERKFEEYRLGNKPPASEHPIYEKLFWYPEKYKLEYLMMMFKNTTGNKSCCNSFNTGRALILLQFFQNAMKLQQPLLQCIGGNLIYIIVSLRIVSKALLFWFELPFLDFFFLVADIPIFWFFGGEPRFRMGWRQELITGKLVFTDRFQAKMGVKRREEIKAAVRGLHILTRHFIMTFVHEIVSKLTENNLFKSPSYVFIPYSSPPGSCWGCWLFDECRKRGRKASWI